MSFFSRLRPHFSNGLLSKPLCIHPIPLKSMNLNWVFSNSTLAAKEPEAQEEEEELEMIDQRKLPADYDPSSFDPTEHRSPPTPRVFRLIDDIANLTLVECAELSGILMKKMSMKEPPIIGVMKPGASAAGIAAAGKTHAAAKEEKKPEKTVFELRLDAYDAASKIKIIKEVRSFTELGLKEAKDLVEKTPAVIKKGVSKEEGEKIVEKMKALGAKVVME